MLVSVLISYSSITGPGVKKTCSGVQKTMKYVPSVPPTSNLMLDKFLKHTDTQVSYLCIRDLNKWQLILVGIRDCDHCKFKFLNKGVVGNA